MLAKGRAVKGSPSASACTGGPLSRVADALRDFVMLKNKGNARKWQLELAKKKKIPPMVPMRENLRKSEAVLLHG